jgi:hypothetical protein
MRLSVWPAFGAQLREERTSEGSPAMQQKTVERPPKAPAMERARNFVSQRRSSKVG